MQLYKSDVSICKKTIFKKKYFQQHEKGENYNATTL